MMMADLPRFISKKTARTPSEIQSLLSEKKYNSEKNEQVSKGTDPVSFFNNLLKNNGNSKT